MQNLIAVTVYIPVSTYAWDYLTYLTMGSLITSGSLFSVRMSNNGVIGWTRALILFVASGLIYLTCALLFKQSVLNDVGTFLWLPGLTVFAVLAVFNLLIKAMKQPNIDALLLSLCFFVALVLSVNDWMVVAGVGYRHNAQLLQFGAIPILLVFSITLLRRFLANAQALTLVNQNLELLITEKTAALEAEFKRNANLEYQNLLAEERERIMRDMHDGVGGSLIRLIAMLKQNTVRDRQLKAHLQSALDDLRMMIDSLEEFDHDVGAVLGVFRHRVEPQLQSTGIQLEWYVSDLSPLPSFGPQQVLHLLRILQELVTNTIKHAYASKISISATSIDGDTDEILLRYSDDGIGFPDEYSAGRGLKHMRFRAREAGFELVYPEAARSNFLIRIPLSKGAVSAN
jgi:signal transduction histidine kinase